MSGRVHPRQPGVLSLALMVCALTLFGFARFNHCFAQGDAESPPGERDDSAAVKLVGPDVYIYVDEDGKERHLLNMSHDDIRALRGSAKTPGEPSYTLDQLVAGGRVRDSVAELTVQINFSLSTDRWVGVPLHLDGAILLEAPQYEGDGEARFVRSRHQDLEMWVRGSREGTHAVQLKVLIAIEARGDLRELRLIAPRATRSELNLGIPGHGVSPQVGPGLFVEPVDGGNDAEEPNGDAQRFRIRGIGGETRIRWRTRETSIVDEPTALEVEGMQYLDVQDRRIVAQVDLKVSSRGRSFDRFDVTLPPGFLAEVNQFESRRFELLGDESPNDEAQADTPQRLRISLEEMTRGPVVVRIEAERPYEVDPRGTPVSLSGFRVEGAIRQGGHVALRVGDGRRVDIVSSENIGRVDQLPVELATDEVDAGFEYYRQPYRLDVTVTPPVASVSVEPEYVVDVLSDEIVMRGQLRYRVSGSNVHELAVNCAGWRLDEESGCVVAGDRVDAAVQDEEGMLRIPLAAGMKGDFVVALTATRKWSAADDSLRFPLPVPANELRGITTLVVLSEDHVQLTPRRDEMVTLTPLRIPLEIELPQRQQKPMFFGTEERDAEFVGGIEIRDRVVRVAVESRVDLAENRFAQTFNYDVAYEPVESIELAVPRRLLTGGNLLMQVNDTPLEFSELAGVGGDAGEDMARITATFPGPMIGNVRLEVRGSIPASGVTSTDGQTRQEVDVPLATPVVGVLTENELLIQSSGVVEFELLDDIWSEAEETDRGARASRRFRSADRASAVRLSVLRSQRPTSTPVLVRKAWVRTWLLPDGRRDRAIYRLRCPDSFLRLELPAGSDVGSAVVYVNGREAEVTVPRRSGESRPVVEVSMPDGPDRNFVIGLQYSVDAGAHRSPVLLETPGFGDDAGVEDLVYYEVLLPPNRNLLRTPLGLTPAWQWQWDRFRWVREPLVSTAELIEWSESNFAESGETRAWSRYLFSTIAVGQSYEFAFAGRATAGLFGAGGVLAIGLALVYLPAMRRPGVLLACAVGLLAMGAIFPQPTLVLAQAGSLGLVLVLAAAVLRGVLKPRPVSLIEPHSAVGSSARLRTTEFHFATKGQGLSSQRTAVMPPAMSSFTHQEPASSKP